MAASDVDTKKMERGNAVGVRNDGRMLLSTTYPLNNSDTKRIQVGLRASIDEGSFVPAIKIMGNTANGVYIDLDSWDFFKESLAMVGSYLRWTTKEIPPQIPMNGVTVNCTTAYGARAIMMIQRGKMEDNTKMAKLTGEDAQPTPPPAKKRKLYTPSIVMQKISVEGLESITGCIDARLQKLQSFARHVNDCARFLVTEIELNLPKKKAVDEDIVKHTLTSQYGEIEENVRRQLSDLQFLDHTFDIVFRELTSLHLNEIVQSIILNAASK